MHRRAGVKMHHGQRRRMVAGAWRSTGQGQPKLSFPVRSMSLLSRPDLASPWPRSAREQRGQNGEILSRALKSVRDEEIRRLLKRSGP
jgi:hypothetical protein